jgi:hypothetical protein
LNGLRLVCMTIAFLIARPALLCAQDQGSSAPGSSEMYNVLVPGASCGIITFFGEGTPIYAGGALRFDLVYSLSRNQPRASIVERGRNELYVDIGLYGSIPARGEETLLLFRYVLGFTTSFETPRSLARNFLVPYIGLELGGIYIQGEGNGFLAVPVLGINLLTLPTFTMSIDTGLILNTIAFERFLGLRSELHVNFVI